MQPGWARAAPLIATLGAILIALYPGCPASSQARYDDHEIENPFRIFIGGYNTSGSVTKLRVDSRSLGLGTLIDLEDGLNLEDSVSVGRLDGLYQFDRAHRLEWAYFSATRRGSVDFIYQDITIGDVTFPLGYQIDSAWKYGVTKVSYAWSFINTSKYEFYVGGGLNVSNLKVGFSGYGDFGGQPEVRAFEDSQLVPLPTLSAGMRYQVSDRLMLRYRIESFTLNLGGDAGRWQDSYFFVDYDIAKHFGIGGGINLFDLQISSDLDDDLTAEFDSSHVGVMIYFVGRF
jgi:hypothetical protein